MQDFDKIIDEINNKRTSSQPSSSDNISSGGTFRIILATNKFTKELIFNPGQDHIENTINDEFNFNETNNTELLQDLWNEEYEAGLTGLENIENYYREVYSNEKYHFYGIGGDIKIYSIDKDNNIVLKIIEASLNIDGEPD